MHSHFNPSRPPKCRACGREAPLWSIHTNEDARRGELTGSALCFAYLPDAFKKKIEQEKR